MQTIDRKILIVAAVALIDVDGRILISKRPDNKYLGGLWEFPGGKLENNEKAEDALIRELEEELNRKKKTLNFYKDRIINLDATLLKSKENSQDNSKGGSFL